MRLYITSDWHFESQPLRTFPRDLPDFDVAIIAGDLDRGVANALGSIAAVPAFEAKPVIFVPGNHEFDGGIFQDVIEQGFRYVAGYPLIHLLYRRSIIIQNVRFIGATLWTDYELYRTTKPSMILAGQSMPDHKAIRTREPSGHISRFMPWHARAEHKRDRAFIEAVLREPHDGPTVVVTHHLPSPRSVFRAFQGHPLSPAFASNLEPVIERYCPSLWVHGHGHNSNDYVIGSTRIFSNPKGYGPYPNRAQTENPTFDDCLIVDLCQNSNSTGRLA